MMFLTNMIASAIKLEDIDILAFVENLQYMGIGMVVIFAIIGIIILATTLINYLFSEAEEE